jgi:hypothetical protein
MGGDLPFKLTGSLAAATPRCLKAVIGFSQLIDVAASSTALHTPK